MSALSMSDQCHARGVRTCAYLHANEAVIANAFVCDIFLLLRQRGAYAVVSYIPTVSRSSSLTFREVILFTETFSLDERHVNLKMSAV